MAREPSPLIPLTPVNPLAPDRLTDTYGFPKGVPRGFPYREGPEVARPGLPLPRGGTTQTPMMAPAHSGMAPRKNATTPELVQARFAPTIRLNPITIEGPTIGGRDGWQSIDIDRPMILWPTGYDLGGVNFSLPIAEVLYAPETKPANDSLAIRSLRRGIAYLSNPGRWWVKYGIAAAATPFTLSCLLIDASDPAVAARYLSEPGPNVTRYFGSVGVNPDPGPSVLLVQANPYRKALTIQNHANPAIRIQVGTPGTIANGIRLPATASVTFAGDTLTLDAVYGMAEGALTGDVVIIEYV